MHLPKPGSGSDAMNIRTHATLSGDGKHYVLNGEEMSDQQLRFRPDLYIAVAAKIDGDKVLRISGGAHHPAAVGAGRTQTRHSRSSSCILYPQRLPHVPVENLLSEIGKGHHIAFNILPNSLFEFKLGAAVVGMARALPSSTASNTLKIRKAFGKSISEFGLIQEKLAECAMLRFIFVGEST